MAAEDKEEPAAPEPIAIGTPVDVRSVALTTIAAVAALYFLQYAQTVLIPVVLGILISYALEPIVSTLH